MIKFYNHIYKKVNFLLPLRPGKNSKTAFLLLLIISISLTSCFKEDEKIDIPKPSETEADTVILGNTYHYQSWVDLNGLQEKAYHEIDSWDLAFSCSESSFDILLNSALSMYAGTNGDTIFENVISEEGIEMRFDASSGNPDSLAFGHWYEVSNGGDFAALSNKYVYIINRGVDDVGNELGFKKTQFLIENGNYIVRYANLDGTEEQTLTITKDNSYNYIHLSFDNGILNIEPPQNEWSLKFSRYATILFTNEGDPYDYNVVGVLLNPYKVEAIETNMNYDDIILSDTTLFNLTNRSDVIGYKWKYYDFDNGSYTIVPNKNYLIKDKDGYFYKLRFLSFYDPFGNKGSIVYQVVRL